jgi:hypothetical protein
MDESEKPLDAARCDLQSISDEQFRGLSHAGIMARLNDESSASLFVLSKKAQSKELQAAAANTLETRLRQDEPPAEPTAAAADAAQVEQSLTELPPELATARHFYKFAEGDRWVLSTRSGVRVRTFADEAELDRWWLGLKKQRGRILTTRRRKGSE